MEGSGTKQGAANSHWMNRIRDISKNEKLNWRDAIMKAREDYEKKPVSKRIKIGNGGKSYPIMINNLKMFLRYATASGWSPGIVKNWLSYYYEAYDWHIKKGLTKEEADRKAASDAFAGSTYYVKDDIYKNKNERKQIDIFDDSYYPSPIRVPQQYSNGQLKEKAVVRFMYRDEKKKLVGGSYVKTIRDESPKQQRRNMADELYALYDGYGTYDDYLYRLYRRASIEDRFKLFYAITYRQKRYIISKEKTRRIMKKKGNIIPEDRTHLPPPETIHRLYNNIIHDEARERILFGKSIAEIEQMVKKRREIKIS